DDMPLVEEETNPWMNCCWPGHDFKILMGSMGQPRYGAQTLEDIVEDVTQKITTNSPTVRAWTFKKKTLIPEEPPITSVDALKAMEIVRHYTEKNFADPAIQAQ
uniref:Uncharacterized protein n=1 Tax=Ditylenchus dipsaci TaxID=166011 RepID=A0A915EIH8_9BILA